MKHLSEEQLIAYQDGERSGREEFAAHITGCVECRAELDRITGMLAALLATAVIQGLLSGMIGFAFVLLALYRKARREESFLSQEFGDGFLEHRQHTGMFLPRFT